MLKLKVPEMSCGHCAQTIEKAVKGVDRQAEVRVDLAAKTVTVDTTAPEQKVLDAVRAAGYQNQ